MILLQDKYLTKEEIKIFLDYLESQSLLDLQYGRMRGIKRFMIFSLLFQSGLRGLEECHLKHKHINFAKESWLSVLGKGSKKRNVIIGSELKKQLKEYIIWKSQCGLDTEPDSFLFTSWGTRCYSQQSLNKMFKMLLKKCGITRPLSLHATRHSYGSHLFQKTKNLRLVQHCLGHSDLRSTQIYLSIVEDMNEAVSGIYS